MPSSGLLYEAMELPRGTELFTVVGKDWPTPHEGYANRGPARFSPIAADDGSIATTLYAGPSPRCALGETVFRDLCGGASVNRRRLEERAMLRTETLRELILADLRPVAARAAGAEFYDQDLGTTIGMWPVSQYQRSAELGSRIYRDTEKHWDGICWESRQAPPDNAYLIFTDRVDLRVSLNPEPLISPAWLAHVGALAAQLRILLPSEL